MSVSWANFYKEAGGYDYFLDHLSIHKDFLKQILKRNPRSALEAGCGSAIMSAFLSYLGIDVTACDRDPEILNKAAEITKKLNASVKFMRLDLLNVDTTGRAFDISFSQGVMEHMTDEEIRSVSGTLLNISQAFVFSVPSIYYRHRDFGDERLMSLEEWERILKGVGTLKLRYYYFTRTKRNFLMKRPLMIMGTLMR